MNEDVIRELAERVRGVEEQAKSAHKRIDDVEKLTESVYTLANETKRMREDLGDIKGRVDNIEQKPARRWELVVATVITAVVSYALGYILH